MSIREGAVADVIDGVLDERVDSTRVRLGSGVADINESPSRGK